MGQTPLAWAAGWVAAVALTGIGALVVLWPQLWSRIFTTDAQVLHHADLYLRMAGPGFAFFGMGLALNDKASFSIGYDQSIVGKTKQNGQTVPGSVRTVLGTLLVGYSYRLSDKRTLNLAIGAGLTRDTPDLTVTLRLPMTF